MNTPGESSSRLDWLWGTAVFAVVLLIFWRSPISGMGDSKYALLVSHQMLTKGTIRLDEYTTARHGGISPSGLRTLDPSEYQLETVNGHVYFYMPPGTAVLSVPVEAVSERLGHSAAGPGDTYNEDDEVLVQRLDASLLMAVLAGVFYFTARLRLLVGWSVVVALGGALGTQIWSTASRDLGSHTWSALLLGGVVYLLLAQATGQGRLHPVLAATLLAWSYFVRPTNSVAILAVTGYVLLFVPRAFLVYALTGAAWGAAFAVYSWVNFHLILPNYFHPKRLGSVQFWEGMAGNLISPSRGLLVFVPVTVFVCYLLARHWRRVPHVPLLIVGGCTALGQWAAVSGFDPWWGGFCYGPRYTTELVPWLVLAAVLALWAALRWREERALRRRSGTGEWWLTLGAGGALLAASVFIQARGALAVATRVWNKRPVTIDQVPARLWDWRQPQFLAGLIRQPLPDVVPTLADGQRVSFGQEAGRAYQLEGWSDSDPDGCWIDGRWARIAFTSGGADARRLRLFFRPALSKGVDHQRVEIDLNGHTLAALTVSDGEAREHVFDLPAGTVRAGVNILTIRTPDAFSPRSQGDGADQRLLGISLGWMELDSAFAPPTDGR